MTAMANTLALIRRIESGSDYDRVWGGIAAPDRPENKAGKPLTSMTVGEAITWAASIDSLYPSEAMGAYQCLDTTLQDLISRGKIGNSSLMNREGQDRIAILLMRQRGLSRAASGTMDIGEFANGLACTWSALPAVKDFTVNGRPVKRGQGVYDSDLNKSLVDPEEFEAAVREDLGKPAPLSDVERIVPHGTQGATRKEKVTIAEQAADALRKGHLAWESIDTSLRNDVLKLAHGKIKGKSRTIKDGGNGQVAAGALTGVGGVAWLANLLPSDYASILDQVQDHLPLLLAAAGFIAFILFGRIIRHRTEDEASGVHKGRDDHA